MTWIDVKKAYDLIEQNRVPGPFLCYEGGNNACIPHLAIVMDIGGPSLLRRSWER